MKNSTYLILDTESFNINNFFCATEAPASNYIVNERTNLSSDVSSDVSSDYKMPVKYGSTSEQMKEHL